MSRDPARRAADELDRRGLAAPARLLADAHRPLGPLLSDLGAALGPLTRAIAGDRAAPVVRWLERPSALDELVDALDAQGERRAGPG
ncbi:MAG TPA: hypothetical protein VF365_04155 [Candidatus Limnocylindria bacterium]